VLIINLGTGSGLARVKRNSKVALVNLSGKRVLSEQPSATFLNPAPTPPALPNAGGGWQAGFGNLAERRMTKPSLPQGFANAALGWLG
jgi:hypothetical protein